MYVVHRKNNRVYELVIFEITKIVWSEKMFTK